MLSHNKIEFSVLVLKRYNSIIYGYHNYDREGNSFSFPLKVVLHPDITSKAQKNDEVVVSGVMKTEPSTKQIVILAQGIEDARSS